MKKGQVWIETVIYTLIAFVLIGLVLTFAKPKIEEFQDNAIIEQSIKVLEDINTIILSLAQGGPGNKRLVDLGIRKGVLTIDGKNDTLVFEIESKYIYSEPGEYINYGNIIVHTEKKGEFNKVTLTSNYTGIYNITYQEKDELKSITKSSTPYKIFISNKGKSGNYTIINMEIS